MTTSEKKTFWSEDQEKAMANYQSTLDGLKERHVDCRTFNFNIVLAFGIKYWCKNIQHLDIF